MPAQQPDARGFAERAPATRLERLIAEKLPSVVKVFGASGLATIEAYAAGVVVGAEGHVLTLDLILLQKGQTRVVLDDGSVHDAELYPPEARLGVRMLKIAPGRPLVPLTVPQGPDPRHGALVVSLGNCFRLAELDERVSATFGVLVARARTGLRYRLTDVEAAAELWITDAPNNPGHYGGALLTLAGEWIGLNARIVESTETNTDISAAIPSKSLADYIARCVAQPPGMVAAAAPPPPERKRVADPGLVLLDQGLRRSPPAYVERVRAGSPAAKAGLRPDDLIVRVGETPVRTCEEYRQALARLEPGSVELTIKRGAQVLQVALSLAEAR